MEYTRKIFVDTNPFGHKAYADYLSLTGETDAPTFLFFGGSISPAKYHAREEGHPENLFSYFREACQTNGLVSANLLTIPCPYGVGDYGSFLDDMEELLTQFFSKTELRFRNVNGIIGNSKGCYWSVGLLSNFSNVKKLVTIAGASMRIADSEAENVSYPEIHCFSNNQDYLRANTLQFIDWLKEKDVPASLVSREGGHDFQDYELNGSVKEAFDLFVSSRQARYVISVKRAKRDEVPVDWMTMLKRVEGVEIVDTSDRIVLIQAGAVAIEKVTQLLGEFCHIEPELTRTLAA